MLYETITTHGSKEIRFKVPRKVFSGNFTLSDFLRTIREFNQSINNKHEYTQEELDILDQMERGEIPITSDYLKEFAKLHRLPQKISRLGIANDTTSKTRFADRLYQLRITRGNDTQADVARIIDVSTNAYTDYESGRSEPDLETLEKIANLYEVSIDYLMDRKYERIIRPTAQQQSRPA